MSYLSDRKKVVDKRKKRLGRGHGSGKGAKSGRGTTRHQTARTDIPLHFEGGQNRLVKKFPLLRGKDRNKSITGDTLVITLDQLNELPKGTTVDPDSLVEHGLIQKGEIDRPIKILANGTIKKSLKITIPVSATAKKKIEEAGGTIV